MKVGETALFPALREAREEIVIADGFSCSEQIAQGTKRRAVHTAEVLQLALHRERRLPARRRRKRALLVGAAAVAGLAVLVVAR
jgi:hypothetical protein